MHDKIALAGGASRILDEGGASAIGPGTTSPVGPRTKAFICLTGLARNGASSDVSGSQRDDCSRAAELLSSRGRAHPRPSEARPGSRVRQDLSAALLRSEEREPCLIPHLRKRR